MPAGDLGLLLAAALEAGDIARRHWREDPQVWHKGEHGPVSEADFEVDAFLRQTLTAARTDYGWLSEETPDEPDNRAARRVFVVDPIDGTRAFINGETTWAHSLAVVEDGVPVAGVVHLPAHGKTYAAERGAGATVNGEAIAASRRDGLDGASVLAARTVFEPAHWRGTPPRVERAFRPSLAYRMCLVAEGRFDAMVTLRPTWEWDVAAGSLICTEAGAGVSTGRGAAPVFNNPDPRIDGLIAAGAGVHADLIRGLSG